MHMNSKNTSVISLKKMCFVLFLRQKFIGHFSLLSELYVSRHATTVANATITGR